MGLGGWVRIGFGLIYGWLGLASAEFSVEFRVGKGWVKGGIVTLGRASGWFGSGFGYVGWDCLIRCKNRGQG